MQPLFGRKVHDMSVQPVLTQDELVRVMTDRMRIVIEADDDLTDRSCDYAHYQVVRQGDESWTDEELLAHTKVARQGFAKALRALADFYESES